MYLKRVITNNFFTFINFELHYSILNGWIVIVHITCSTSSLVKECTLFPLVICID